MPYGIMINCTAVLIGGLMGAFLKDYFPEFKGASIRDVQELLGHASIVTTQIYTEVSIDRRRQVLGNLHQLVQIHELVPYSFQILTDLPFP